VSDHIESLTSEGSEGPAASAASVSGAVPTLSGGPISQTRASDAARQFLLALIFTGTLGPGDRLPTERDLSAQLGISRLTLREALKSLEMAGYLVTRVGSQGGTRVNDAAALARCFGDWLRSQGERVEHLREVQRIIEVTVASLAAERRTDADLEVLEAAQIPQEVTRRVVLERHRAFHEGLARATHNARLAELMKEIRDEIFIPFDYLLSDEWFEGMRNFHARILEAVRDQDPGRAALEMESHLFNPSIWKPTEN
jgi:GntR family transcriptional regulator, transcriptional repressor for pyruvate dehydrogenase complex